MSVEVSLVGADPRAPLGRTLRIARPVLGRLVLAIALGAGAVAADIGLIATAAWLISKAAQHPNESQLALAIVAVQFFGLSRGILRYCERLVGHDAAFRLLAEQRVQVFSQLERLAPSGIPAFRRGDLLARIVRDVDTLQDLLIRVLTPFASALLVASLTILVLWWILPAAAVILAVALLLAGTVVPALTARLARRKEARFAATRGELASAVLDLAEGAEELVAFGAMGAQVELVRQRDAELNAIAARSAGTAGIGLSLTTLLAGLACVGNLLVGIPALRTGQLDPTDLAVIALIPLAAFGLVVGLPVATQSLHRVRQSAARIFELSDAPTPVSDPQAPNPLPNAPYDLQGTDILATYPGAASPALIEVSLSLRPGRRVALVGRSGAGKSTLGLVLCRFLDYRGGTVTLNSTPIDHLAGDQLRRVVGYLDQDAYLFDASLAENLRVGRRDASDPELHDALARVGLAGWVADLPLGLRTAVGRHGSQLSGGQRQRVAVARALLADYPVLVLDEPAEHLDVRGADALTADILRATSDCTLLMITHRLADLDAFDEIMVLDKGMVAERGRHDELLAAGGRYARLWYEQARDTPSTSAEQA